LSLSLKKIYLEKQDHYVPAGATPKIELKSENKLGFEILGGGEGGYPHLQAY